MARFKYLGAAVSAYFMWGFFSFGLKPLIDYAPTDILFFRLLISFLVLLVIMVGFRREKVKQDLSKIKAFPKRERHQKIALFVVSTILLLANWFTIIIVMNHVSVKAASLAYLICPILTTVLSFFIMKDQMTKEKWLAVGLSFLSCVLLAYGHAYDLMFSLIVALTFALYLIFQKKLNFLDSLNNITVQLGGMVILLLPYYIYTGAVIPTASVFYYSMSAIVVFFTILPMFLSNYALKGINSSTAGILIYINPIINFCLALFYYHEPITVTQLVAYGTIVVSIIIFNSRMILSKAQQRLVKAHE